MTYPPMAQMDMIQRCLASHVTRSGVLVTDTQAASMTGWIKDFRLEITLYHLYLKEAAAQAIPAPLAGRAMVIHESDIEFFRASGDIDRELAVLAEAVKALNVALDYWANFLRVRTYCRDRSCGDSEFPFTEAMQSYITTAASPRSREIFGDRLASGGNALIYAHALGLESFVRKQLRVDDALELSMKEAWLHACASMRSNVIPLAALRFNAGKVEFIMPYAPYGTLRSVLAWEDNSYYNQTVICLSVAYILQDLKGLGIVHGDLKPANLLIDRTKRISLGDFGHAAFEGEELNSGTWTVNAPERDGSTPVTHAMDLWSLGAVIYQTLSFNQHLYPSGFRIELHELETYIQGKFDALAPSLEAKGIDPRGMLRTLALDLLKVDPTKRISVETVIERLLAEQELIRASEAPG